MPRRRRTIRPYTLIHVITRFLNHEFLINSEEERTEYLHRVSVCFGRSDWGLLSFALMSTHTHFAAIAGALPFADISRPLHSGYAQWLNPRRGRLGPVVAARPATKELPMRAAGRLIAYHHNNPVKAGLVERAVDSTWTSHRFYIGQPAPEWLDVELGLELSGFSPAKNGREAFAQFVDASVGDDMDFGDEDVDAARNDARAMLGTSVELGNPRQELDGRESAPIVAPSGALIRASWGGDLLGAVALVCEEQSVRLETVLSRSRVRNVVRCRRLVVLSCHGLLDRSLTDVAGVLGISLPAARKLERTATAEERAHARRLTELIRTACA